MKASVGFGSIDYKVEGEPFVGRNEVLAKLDDDLTARRNWHKQGYVIKKFLPSGTYLQFHGGMEELFRKCLTRAGIEVNSNFKASNYHELVKGNYDLHLKVIEQTKLLQWYDLPIHVSIIEEVVSEIVSVPVRSIKPINGERVFHFRVVRPGEPDFNPLHRDAWQAENKGAINIYVPLVGSNQNSSLLLAPGSHLWPEHRITRTKEGAVMNGVKFNVPGVIDSQIPITLERPNPGINHVMVFSPYLIHGGAVNKNRRTTRISLEMRFWRK
jgi:hypothetical protein